MPAAFEGVDGVQVLVGGEPAFFTDFLDVANRYQWIVLVFVLGLSFMLLTVGLPLDRRADQGDPDEPALGRRGLRRPHARVPEGRRARASSTRSGSSSSRTTAIEAWLPLFLFSVLFGLSMDYHVFLLSRIREEYDKTGDNTEAVAYGLRTTAGIITGAALIMVAVFTGFAAGRLGPLQQMGFGLGGRGVHGRHDRPDAARAGQHAPARRLELVPAPSGSSGCRRSTSRGASPTQRVLEPRIEPIVLDDVEVVPVADR